MIALGRLRRLLIGRFAIGVLEDLQRVAQTHVCGLAVNVKELSWPCEGKDRLEVLWKTQLDTVMEREPPTGANSAVIEQREIEPGIRGVLYHASVSNPRIQIFAALLDAGSLPVWFRVTGYEAISQRMVPSLLDVVHAYRARPEEYAAVPEPGLFHLERGAVALPFLGKEETEVHLEARALGLRFHVETESVDKVNPPGLLERFAQATAALSGARPPVKEVRSGRRKVAGLDGEELVLRGTDRQPARVMLTWLYLGEKSSGTRPQVTLSMDAFEEDLDEKLALWDRMLDSMRSTEA